jgi:tetratricopeptide (TPR) repeat protein
MYQIIASLLLLISSAAFSQDLKGVQRSIASNDWKNARLQVDSYLGDSLHQREAGPWYYKGKIYTELSRSSKGGEKWQLQQQALRSFKNYQQLDSLNTLMELDKNVDLFRIYDASYNEGISLYNSKQFDEAYRFFKNALDAKDYIYSKGFSLNGFSFTSLDTQLVNLAGMAAWQSGREEEALGYFQKIVEAKIKAPVFKSLFGLVASDYLSKARTNPSPGNPYSMGSDLYPDEKGYWEVIATSALQPPHRSAALEKLMESSPDYTILLLQYGTELVRLGGEGKLSLQEAKKRDTVLDKLVQKEKTGQLDAYEKMRLRGLLQNLVNQLADSEPARAEVYRRQLKTL